MSKGIMGNGGFERCFSMIEENSTNTYTDASLSFLLKHLELQSSNNKLSLSIGVVAYALVLWDNLCRNSCISRGDVGTCITHLSVHMNLRHRTPLLQTRFLD